MTDQPSPKTPHPRIILNELEKDLARQQKVPPAGAAPEVKNDNALPQKDDDALPAAMKRLDEVLKEIHAKKSHS